MFRSEFKMIFIWNWCPDNWVIQSVATESSCRVYFWLAEMVKVKNLEIFARHTHRTFFSDDANKAWFPYS